MGNQIPKRYVLSFCVFLISGHAALGDLGEIIRVDISQYNLSPTPTITPEWTFELPTEIHVRFTCDECDDASVEPEVKITLYDCYGNEIDDDSHLLPRPGCGGHDPGDPFIVTFTRTFVFELDCEGEFTLPGYYIVEFKDVEVTIDEQTEECTESAVWRCESGSPHPTGCNSHAVTNIEEEFEWTCYWVAGFECHSCDPPYDEFSADPLIWYKGDSYEERDTTMYTFPTSDKSGCKWAEAVNGAFLAPEDGLLEIFATVEDNIKDSIVVNAGGWILPTLGTPSWTSGGLKILYPGKSEGYFCDQLTAGYEHRFHVRTMRGDSSGKIILVFRWWKDHEYNDMGDDPPCCIPKKVTKLEITVQPMTMELSDRYPVTPKRYDHLPLPIFSGPVNSELKLPRCSTGDNTGYGKGNLTRRFVAWPTPAGRPIEQGFAKGWVLTENAIKTPSPNSVTYRGQP